MVVCCVGRIRSTGSPTDKRDPNGSPRGEYQRVFCLSWGSERYDPNGSKFHRNLLSRPLVRTNGRGSKNAVLVLQVRQLHQFGNTVSFTVARRVDPHLRILITELFNYDSIGSRFRDVSIPITSYQVGVTLSNRHGVLCRSDPCERSPTNNGSMWLVLDRLFFYPDPYRLVVIVWVIRRAILAMLVTPTVVDRIRLVPGMN